MTDVILATADDPELFDLHVGDTCLVKGKLEAVRYGGRPRLNRAFPGRDEPSAVITHADWSMTSIAVYDEATARSIRVPLGTYVTVRCQVINEDAELAAIAIWVDDNPVPMIVGEMREIC